MAQLLYLKLEKPISDKDAIRDVFLSLQQAQGLAKIAYSNLRNKSKVYNILKLGPVKENAEDFTGYTREAVEEKNSSELDKIKDKKTKEALKWLGAE